MLHVETVDLSQRGVALPSQSVGMVIAQPHLPPSALTSVEPYQCTHEAKQRQLLVLDKTLEVARAAPHGNSKTHFTIFPEYSIPGAEGIARIESKLRSADWPKGTIVIGGTDALTQQEYVELLTDTATHVDIARNGADKVKPHQWVNCAITWVKGEGGNLERWIQPKLHPAWEETTILHQHMFRGRSVFLFKGLREGGEHYRFGTLICFDWIANLDTKTPCQWILEDIHEQANGAQLPVTWLFIIQRNRKPSHDTFLNGVEDFFNQTQFPNALRERACLVFANTAGRAIPGRTSEFGGCSVVSSPQSLFQNSTCSPTFSRGGSRFRDNSNRLADYKDSFFRERGACIHSFSQINPASLLVGPRGRKFAIEDAFVFPLHDSRDPRTPAAPVPACIKWLNDELDELPRLSATYPLVALAAQSDSMHEQIVIGIRSVSPQSADHGVKLATAIEQGKGKSRDADEWDNTETEALENLINSLTVIGLGCPVATINAGLAHATAVINGQNVDILAIRGSTHEICHKHTENFYQILPRRNAILISRDKDNNHWQRKFGSFLDPITPQLGQDQDITNPSGKLLHLGYRKLLDIFQNSNTSTEVQGSINATLTV